MANHHVRRLRSHLDPKEESRYKKLGRRIAAARTEKGYNQRTFAIAAGLGTEGISDEGQTLVSRIELGQRQLYLEEALVMAKVLGKKLKFFTLDYVNPSDFYYDEDE